MIRRNVPLTKPLAIIGSGRSGTLYTTLLLRRLGIDVGHEQPGRDGIVSGWIVPTVDPETSVVLHQVRNPLLVIPSTCRALESSWRRVREWVPLPERPLLLRALHVWVLWNEIAQRKARWTYRIEDITSALPRLCDEIGIKRVPMPPMPARMHASKVPPSVVTWEQLMCLDVAMTMRAQTMAASYGYPA